MLRLSVHFFCNDIFREKNLLIDFLPENTHKMTLKVLTIHSQNASKKCILVMCT